LFIHRSREIAEKRVKETEGPSALPDKSSLTQALPPADPPQTLNLLHPQKEDPVFGSQAGVSTFYSQRKGSSTFDKCCGRWQWSNASPVPQAQSSPCSSSCQHITLTR